MRLLEDNYWIGLGFLSFGLLLLAIHLSFRVIRLSGLLEKKEREVQSLNRQRTEFIANVSHELKTPLTSIRGFAETLIDGSVRDPEKSKEFLHKILSNTERLDSLIHDILDLAKLEATDAHLEIERFEVLPFLLGIKEDFSHRLEQKNQILTIECRLKTLVADRYLMEQCIGNLVSNANRYCPEGSIIEIRANPEGDRARIEVVDNGPGISHEDLPRIFERFYRADKSRSRLSGGTGLGLAIVKHVVLNHRGQVSAENLSSGGLKFNLSIPQSEF